MLQSPYHPNKGKHVIQTPHTVLYIMGSQQTCDINTTYSGINMGSQQQQNTVVVVAVQATGEQQQ